MVQEHVGNNEIESENFYDVGNMQSESASTNTDYEDDSNKSTPKNNHVAVGSFDMSNVRDNNLKYSIVQQHWNNLHSEENS